MGNEQSKKKTSGDPDASGSTVTKTKLGLALEPQFQPCFEYPIDGKGLFVIIRNDTMNYEHYLESTGEHEKFGDLSVGYKKDETLLKRTFQIVETDEDQHNVLIGRNLHHKHDHSEAEEQFDGFMEQKVLGYKGDPKFILFVLMSHGLENGVFLLGNNLQEPCCRKPLHKCDKSEPKCCKKNPGDCCRKRDEKYHFQTGKCHERRVKEDIIEPIQKRFKGVPKIFIIQACRGAKQDDLLSKSKNKSADIEPPKVGNFFPRSADTIVLYSGANEQESYVDNNASNPRGSLLIYEFCSAVEELQRKLVSIEPTLARLRNLTGQAIDDEDDVVSVVMSFIQTELAGTHDNPDMRIEVESAIGGWLDDICRLTALNVARGYLIQQKSYNKANKLVSIEPLTMAQPEVVSTLNSRVSCIKLMRTQIPDWGTSSVGEGDGTS